LLRGVVNLARKKDGSCTRAKNRAAPRGVLKETCVEAFLDEKLPLRRALATRQDYRVHNFQIARRAHKYVLDAHARERRCMRFKVTLNGQYSDFHSLFAHQFQPQTNLSFRGAPRAEESLLPLV
jgi:hypothetical protein